MSKAEVTGVTVSVEFGFEQDYGKGTKSFSSIQAKYPEPQNVDNLSEVISDGLEMYFAAWRTLLSARYATGVLKASEYKESLTSTAERIDKVRAYLKSQEKNGK